MFIFFFFPQDMQEAAVASVFSAGVHYEGRLACACASSRCSSVFGQTEPDAGLRKSPAACHGDNCKYLRNWSLIIVGYSIGQLSNMLSLLTAIQHVRETCMLSSGCTCHTFTLCRHGCLQGKTLFISLMCTLWHTGHLTISFKQYLQGYIPFLSICKEKGDLK